MYYTLEGCNVYCVDCKSSNHWRLAPSLLDYYYYSYYLTTITTIQSSYTPCLLLSALGLVVKYTVHPPTQSSSHFMTWINILSLLHVQNTGLARAYHNVTTCSAYNRFIEILNTELNKVKYGVLLFTVSCSVELFVHLYVLSLLFSSFRLLRIKSLLSKQLIH